MALVDVVRQQELDRLRVCHCDDCHDVLFDLSKNRSRRYCSTTCANRVNVAAFRRRRARSGADRHDALTAQLAIRPQGPPDATVALL